MKAKIRKDTMQGKELLAVISFALAWSEHFIEDKNTYKHALEPKVYREIKSILPDVLKFCTNLSLDIMKDLSNKKIHQRRQLTLSTFTGLIDLLHFTYMA